MDKMEQNQPSHDFAAPPYTSYYPQPSPQPHLPQQLQLPPQPSLQPSVIIATAFGSESQHLICPHCQADISTRVVTEPNMKTHLFAFLLCVLGLCCCVPCPYCMDSCLVKKHYCPSCASYLGMAEN